jgi:predicted phosphodiesterase
MKACVFSDIHGNGPAFEEALKLINSEAADLNIFLGDLCGYYFDEIEIFEQLVKIPNLIALRGNHDQMFIDALSGNQIIRKSYKTEYSLALEEFFKKDSKEIISWLKSLETQFVHPDKLFQCFHGSPRDPLWEYVYPYSDFEQFQRQEGLIFLGHTHESFVKQVDECWVMNPGSIGQPRDWKLPSLMVVNLKTKKVQYKHFRYDYQALLQKIDGLGCPGEFSRKVILDSFGL